MSAGYFVLLIGILITVYDVWIIVKKGKQASVSAWFISYSKKYAMIPFGIGILCAHLFWSMSDFDWMEKGDLVKKCEQYLKDNK